MGRQWKVREYFIVAVLMYLSLC